MPTVAQASPPPERGSSSELDSHPCPEFEEFKVAIKRSSFDASGRFTHAARSESGNCQISLTVDEPGAGSDGAPTMQLDEVCVVAVIPRRHETGLAIATTRAGQCGGISAQTTITITQPPLGGAVSGASSTGQRSAKAVTTGLDPVSRVMFFHRVSVSWTYMFTDVTEWTWAILRRALPSWKESSRIVDEGDLYDVARREVRVRQEVFWRSPEGFKEAVGVAMDVSITTRSTVVGLPRGAYSCTFWDSDFDGVWNVAGFDLVNLEPVRICVAS